MKSIFDKATRDELIGRINSLKAGQQAAWGKMNVSQMVRHCILCDEYYFGAIPAKRSFLGRLIGRLAIRQILKDEASTFPKNSSTPRAFKVTEAIANLENEKEKWKGLIERYASFGERDFTHWFFGKMSKEELGQLVYKHSDHHLRQFRA